MNAKSPVRSTLVLLSLLILSGPALAQVRDYAYLPIPDRGSIRVFDTITQTFVAIVNVGIRANSVAFSPDGMLAFAVPDGADGCFPCSLGVVNASADRLETHVVLEGRPTSVAFHPLQSVAYVTIYLPEQGRDLLSVLDTGALLVLATVSIQQPSGDVAISPDGQTAFVPTSHSISVLDATMTPPTLVDSIELGSGTASSVAFAPDSTFAYVIPELRVDPQNIIWVVDIATREVTAIDFESNIVPQSVVFNSAGTRAYVTTFNADPGGGANLVEIDTATRTVLRSIGFGPGLAPAGVALTSDGTRAYVSALALLQLELSFVTIVDTGALEELTRERLGAPTGIAIATLPRPPSPRVAYVTGSLGSVSVIDTDNPLLPVAAFAFAGNARGVAFHPDGMHAYIADGPSPPTVKVIDTATQGVVAEIDLGGGLPTNIVVDPAGSFVYVTNPALQSVQVINAEANTLDAAIPVGSGAIQDIAITPLGDRVYVTEFVGGGSVVEISTVSRVVTATIPTGGAPYYIAITPDGALAYVTNNNSLVFVIDTNPTSPTFHSILTTIDLGGGGNGGGVAVSPDGSFVYAVDEGSIGAIVRIDTASQQIGTRILVGPSPQAVTFTRGQSFAFVANRANATVSVIEPGTDSVLATIPIAPGGASWIGSRQ